MFSYVLCVILASAMMTQAEVLKLKLDNFDETIATGRTLVKFFAPWCGHCRAMAPAYERASEEVAGSEIKIAEVDCDDQLEVCSRFSVGGFPSLMLFDSATKQVIAYRGARETANFVSFAKSGYKQMAGKPIPPKSAGKPAPTMPDGPLSALELDDTNALETIRSKKGLWLLKMYAPWCGHCKKFAPVFESAARALEKTHKDIHLAKINCDGPGAGICVAFKAAGYPTVKVYDADNDLVYSYRGKRTEESVIEYMTTFASLEDKALDKRAKLPATNEEVAELAAERKRKREEAAKKKAEADAAKETIAEKKPAVKAKPKAKPANAPAEKKAAVKWVNWNVAEVQEWVKSLSLKDHLMATKAVENMHITGYVLPDMKEADWMEAGVFILGDRKTLARKVLELTK